MVKVKKSVKEFFWRYLVKPLPLNHVFHFKTLSNSGYLTFVLACKTIKPGNDFRSKMSSFSARVWENSVIIHGKYGLNSQSQFLNNNSFINIALSQFIIDAKTPRKSIDEVQTTKQRSLFSRIVACQNRENGLNGVPYRKIPRKIYHRSSLNGVLTG